MRNFSKQGCPAYHAQPGGVLRLTTRASAEHARLFAAGEDLNPTSSWATAIESGDVGDFSSMQEDDT